jgi:hypothetical protein
VINQAVDALKCETGTYEITGCWLTRQCDEAVVNNQSLNRWVDRVYSFYADGTTKSVEIHYDNAQCSGTPTLGVVPPFADNLTYVVVPDSYTNSEGYEIFGIALVDNVMSTAYVAYYHVTPDNELCFTENILLGSLYSSFSDYVDEPIDFDNCLVLVH